VIIGPVVLSAALALIDIRRKRIQDGLAGSGSARPGSAICRRR